MSINNSCSLDLISILSQNIREFLEMSYSCAFCVHATQTLFPTDSFFGSLFSGDDSSPNETYQ